MYDSPTIASDSNLWCAWVASNYNTTFYIEGLPHVIYYVVLAGLSVHVFYHCIKVATSAGGGSFSKLWKSFKVLFLIIVLMLLYFPTFIFGGYVYYGKVDTEHMIGSYTSWIECQVTHFVSGAASDQQELMDICGQFPSDRVSMPFRFALVGDICLATAFIVFITFNSDVTTHYAALLQAAGILPYCEKMVASATAGVQYLKQLMGSKSQALKKHSKICPVAPDTCEDLSPAIVSVTPTVDQSKDAAEVADIELGAPARSDAYRPGIAETTEAQSEEPRSEHQAGADDSVNTPAEEQQSLQCDVPAVDQARADDQHYEKVDSGDEAL